MMGIGIAAVFFLVVLVIFSLSFFHSRVDVVDQDAFVEKSDLATIFSSDSDEKDMTFEYSMYMRQASSDQIYKVSYVEEGNVLIESVSNQEAKEGMDEIGQEEMEVISDTEWNNEAYNIGALLGELTKTMVIKAMPSGTLYYLQTVKGHIQIIDDPALLDEFEGEGWKENVHEITDEEAAIFESYLAEWEQVYAQLEQEEKSEESSGQVDSDNGVQE